MAGGGQTAGMRTTGLGENTRAVDLSSGPCLNERVRSALSGVFVAQGREIECTLCIREEEEVRSRRMWKEAL